MARVSPRRDSGRLPPGIQGRYSRFADIPVSNERVGDDPRIGDAPASTFAHCDSNPTNRAMTDRKTDSPETYRPSLDADRLRSSLLLTGTQVMIALLGAVLLTNGVLA